ncbi:MAG: Glu/Leu/Phe/Val dehydrogenase dimerization domain-containing protein [Bacteroidota bacterium]|jgi:glutamate dehydrogenase/leucine dehydrogenase
MLDKLKKFEEQRPEIVFEWKDRETDAEGWLVINSLRGGAAGGGTRMRKGLDKHEVTSLAKTMEVKFSVAGPQIGGAKSGINFDPSDPRKEGVLRRWFKAVHPILKHYYGTGGDLNVDEIHDVIAITSENGLLHPQEGVVNGHLGSDEKTRHEKILRLRMGVVLPVTTPGLRVPCEKNYTVADMITGFGVAESIRHFYELSGKELKGKRVIIQGWGNVGAAAGYYLSKCGASISGIIDRDGGVLKPQGFTSAEISHLFMGRDGNRLVAHDMLSFEEINAQIWDSGAEIFVPAAASRLVNREQLDRMINAGLETISCGANVPFADKEIFVGPTAAYADSRIALIPDFISNCGMARVFAYLITDDGEVTDQAIFEDVSFVIRDSIEAIKAKNSLLTGIAGTAFSIALDKLKN